MTEPEQVQDAPEDDLDIVEIAVDGDTDDGYEFEEYPTPDPEESA